MVLSTPQYTVSVMTSFVGVSVRISNFLLEQCIDILLAKFLSSQHVNHHCIYFRKWFSFLQPFKKKKNHSSHQNSFGNGWFCWGQFFFFFFLFPNRQLLASLVHQLYFDIWPWFSCYIKKSICKLLFLARMTFYFPRTILPTLVSWRTFDSHFAYIHVAVWLTRPVTMK